MFSEITAALLGAILGGGLNIYTNYLQKEERKECIACAFHSEIKYIMKACNFWEYELLIEDYKKKAQNKEPIPTILPNSINKDSAFKIYNELMKDAMLLPQPVVEKIILFYGNLLAIFGDIQFAYTNWLDNRNIYGDRKLVEIYAKDLGLYKQAMLTGEELLRELPKCKKRKIPGFPRCTGRYVPFKDKILDTQTGIVSNPIED